MLIWLRLLFPPTTSPYHITGTSAFTSVDCCPVQFVVGCRSNLVALLFYLFVISLVTKLGTTFSQSGSRVIFRGFYIHTKCIPVNFIEGYQQTYKSFNIVVGSPQYAFISFLTRNLSTTMMPTFFVLKL